MTHLTREQLLRWRDGHDESDRDRIVGHLAACDACGAAYAELMRTEPAADAPLTLAPDDFVAAGIQAGAPAAPRRWWQSRATWIALPAAAAAALVLLTLAGRPVMPEPDATIRGTNVVAMTPSGTIDRVSEFRWTSPYAAARYRVVVLDHRRAVVLSTETRDEFLPASVPSGKYVWKVEALDASGSTIAASREQPFEVR